MRELMNLTKALADENRVRALLALRDGELCACQIIELLNLAGSTVSKHLSVLYQARLVDMRKEGRWVFYSLAGPSAAPAVRSTLDWLFGVAAGEPQFIQDTLNLQRIRLTNPSELCRTQCKK
jgi:ArsR family transcriptional regulator, arsenate/arsenite/antimonite-responsive transcriptional repressor